MNSGVHAGLEVPMGDPTAELRRATVIGAGLVVAFGFWGFTWQLDAAALGKGQVGVSGSRETIQSRHSGVLTKIHVTNGQHVRAGQLLIEFAPHEVKANERSASSEYIYAIIERSRLLAELRGSARIEFPPELSDVRRDDRGTLENFLSAANAKMDADRANRRAEKAVLSIRISEVREQISGFREQVRSLDEQSALIEQELEGVRTLAAKGYSPLTRVRAMERAAAELRGSKASLKANIARGNEQITELSSQGAAQDSDRTAKLHDGLRAVDEKLSTALPQLDAARERLGWTALRASVSGRVVGMSPLKPGSVVEIGKPLFDVVPDNAPLIINAEVKPVDAADLRVGQKTQVKVLAWKGRRSPVLQGHLSKLSADALPDSEGRSAVFTVEVTVPQTELARANSALMPPLRAGLPVEVMIPLRARSAIEYLVEPLTDAMWGSFREQ